MLDPPLNHRITPIRAAAGLMMARFDCIVGTYAQMPGQVSLAGASVYSRSIAELL